MRSSITEYGVAGVVSGCLTAGDGTKTRLTVIEIGRWISPGISVDASAALRLSRPWRIEWPESV